MTALKDVFVNCAVAIAGALLLGACSPSSKLPPSRSVSVSQNTQCFDGGNGAKFTFWRWESKQEGRDYKQGIMIGLDFNWTEVTTGSNHMQRTVATGFEGRRVEWEFFSPEAKPVEFSMDGNRYDLAKGSLFLVTTASGQKNIQQLDEKLPDSVNDLELFAKTNAVVAKFVAEAAQKK